MRSVEWFCAEKKKHFVDLKNKSIIEIPSSMEWFSIGSKWSLFYLEVTNDKLEDCLLLDFPRMFISFENLL